MKKYLVVLGLALMLLSVWVHGSEVQAKDVVLVLDPGHDAADPGARRTWDGISYEEETIVLKMAKYCRQELETYEGVRVYLTRTTNDVAMDRYDRVLVAKNVGADALVSLHINSTSAAEGTATGALACVPTYSNTADYAVEARALASEIVENLSTVGMKNLGFQINESLGILYYGKVWEIPTMIIEHGFINNPSDCKKYFKSNSKIRKVAVADAQAIAKFYGLKKKEGWQQEGSYWVYYDEEGNKVTGWLRADGRRYYLDSSGHRVSGFCKIDGKRYYFDEDGSAHQGLLKIGNKLYVTKSGGQVRTGWFTTANGNRYYAAGNGRLYLGFQTYKGKTYYFSRKTGEALKGLQLIRKKYYYFDRNGRMRTGWVKIKGKTYYFNSKGVRMTGWVKVRGSYYYLNKKTGAKMTDRWIKVKGKYYYLDGDGVRLTNTRKVIDGKKYRFDAKGVCMNKK